MKERGGEVWDFVLRRIGGDDFKIAAVAKREQGVARTASRVNAADGGADAGVVFDESNSRVQVVGAEQNVIEHRGGLGSSQYAGSEGGCGCEQEKLAAVESH